MFAPAWKNDDDFLHVQDEYLKEETATKGITDMTELQQIQPGLYLWQGDITTLCCDVIVNAANSGMTGCYVPNHRCIDNTIHTFADVQLRCKCAEIMEQQGYAEPTVRAKITHAYNLPCRYILHTVGPISTGEFHFPNDLAAQIAVQTIKDFLGKDTSVKKVIFNVFKDMDKAIYQRLLAET